MGIKPPLMTSDDPTVKNTKRAAEFVHRRLATIVTMGMFFQDGSTDSAGCDWVSLHGVSAAQLEYEPGGQAPVGPLGFRRLPHGRQRRDSKRRRSWEYKQGALARWRPGRLPSRGPSHLP